MANKVILSKFGSLNLSDLGKGAILAVGAPVLYLLQELIPGWNVDPIVKVALSALITYLIKNYFSPAAVTTTYDTNEKAEAVAEKL
jgi:hypothetical protein